MLTISLIVLGSSALLIFGAFGFLSIHEREPRAARLAFGTAITTSLPFFLSALLPDPIKGGVLAVVAAATVVGVILFLLPIGRVERGDDASAKRFDERDIMFARARLEPGSPNYDAYYAKRPHIDGNYRIIAPLVARDAGLGEIGRMGLLMTPELGPRVRLGIVTTDLPLLPDQRDLDDTSLLDFCRTCKKCADNCPVRAIPRGDRQDIDGALRWRINDELCFRYWNVVGTDCGRCMSTCPYSYPSNPFHNSVRWAARRSGMARRLVLWMDSVFYGSRPAPKLSPGWAPHWRSGGSKVENYKPD